MLDYLIKNATVVDGTGSAAYAASVGITGEKITAIITEGPLPEAKCVVDAKGSVLAPGFIDIHSHSDSTMLYDATGDNMIVQGVTSHVSGNCGSSVAPDRSSSMSALKATVEASTAPTRSSKVGFTGTGSGGSASVQTRTIRPSCSSHDAS